MLIKMTEFFMNLPHKKCSTCGKEFEEQHECYVNTCNECFEILNPKSNNKPEETIKIPISSSPKKWGVYTQKLA